MSRRRRSGTSTREPPAPDTARPSPTSSRARRRQALRDGHDYFFLSTDAPPERALRSYLLRRSAQS